MTMTTLYSLFGEDIKIAFFTKKEDNTFNIITIVALALFIIEIILDSLSIEGYFNSFNFWLNIVSTLTLITDITWVWHAIIGQHEDYDSKNAE